MSTKSLGLRNLPELISKPNKKVKNKKEEKGTKKQSSRSKPITDQAANGQKIILSLKALPNMYHD